MTHKCPVCEVQVPRQRFACRSHWYALPMSLRSEIWRTYRADPLGAEHLEAMKAADQYLEERFGKKVFV